MEKMEMVAAAAGAAMERVVFVRMLRRARQSFCGIVETVWEVVRAGQEREKTIC